MHSSLLLPPPASLAEADYRVGDANREAHCLVHTPASWGAYGLRLIGPEGAGRTHLATIFAAHSLGEVIDDADRMAEDMLFHRLQAGMAGKTPLLLTARDDWQPRLPDLASRWRALPVVQLAPPDDALLSALLAKLFADRQLRVGPEVAEYLLKRMPRSYRAASEIVAALDARSLFQRSEIGVKLVREVLDVLE